MRAAKRRKGRGDWTAVNIPAKLIDRVDATLEPMAKDSEVYGGVSAPTRAEAFRILLMRGLEWYEERAKQKKFTTKAAK